MSDLTALKINLRASLIQSLEEIKPLAGSPQIKRYLSLIKIKNDQIISGSGFSLDAEKAQNSAIGESIERYCANLYKKKDIILDSYIEIKEKYENVLNPESITKYTSEQYLYLKKYREYKPEKKFSWISAQSLISRKEILVPFELIYLCSDPFNKPFRDLISTGLACGPTLELAIVGGLTECIERDSFMHFWLLGLVNYEINLFKIIDNKIEDLIGIANNSNLSLRSFDITTDIGIPTILTMVKVNNRPGFYLGCASSFDSKVALLKSIEEGIGGFSVYFEYINQNPTLVPKKLDENSSLDDHPIYYLAGNNDEILSDLLLNIPIQDLDVIQLNLESALKKISLKGYEVLSKDITTSDIREIGLSVVRVSIPQLAYLSINDPLLDCKRIVKKINNSDFQLNLEPHPFP